MVRNFSVFLVIIFFSSCASTYNFKATAVHGAYHRSDYATALELIEKLEPAPRDRLLYLFDKGMILHTAGRYEDSNKALSEAEELSNQNAVKSASRETAAALWSEEATEYAGDKHERAAIPVIKLLNYVMLGDWDGALVEVRHLRLVAEKIYGNSKDFDNAFSLYMSAIIWETLGARNDALIDYKQIVKAGKFVPYVSADVLAESKKLGLPAGPEGAKLNSTVSEAYRKKPGQLIVILETGASPRYEASWVATGYFTVSVPMLMGGDPGVDFADVKIDGRRAGRTYSFYNISEDIFDALRDRQKRSFIRKMLKLGVQGGLYGAGHELAKSDEAGEKAAGLAMIILGLSMSAAEQADTRSMRTLPAEFQIGRFYLDPGEHKIEIIPSGTNTAPIRRTVEVKKERPAVVVAHYPESGEFSKTAVGGVRARRIKEEARVAEARLEKEIKSRPKDGRLKLELASAKMELGDYAVASLLEDALKNGAGRKKTLEMLIISKTVSGDLEGAREDAKMGAAEHLSGRFEAYEEDLSYLTGGKDSPAKENDKDSTNGFDHYIAGLVDAKDGHFDRAAVEFAKAHNLGLWGKPVAKKIIENYQKTGKDFRESDEGLKVAESVADVYME